ncbi:AAA family ATPase [Jannaschia seohaensis]|uniref:Flp pilus assembly CpaE family ATPase n=1 Tax=Jannaschia seohaensis TaxID=475081 RepID=A0A2Y9AJ58_9RHOB|nr:AAA family ATPase [Jannaschia seohaensis]PWJ20303.1 Flp pilus assembly CpaE family ATPase [Jannaschia seohaensis]SSA44330.1 Flp pilus assembly protein, ATPase CpaE [Jannaschia seohaensis]
MHNKIAVFSSDDLRIASVKKSLRRTPSMRVEAHRESLAGLNGSAALLAENVDLIVIEAGHNPDEELAALTEFRRKIGTERAILALADEALSLRQARQFREAGVDEILPDSATPEELGERIEWLTRGQQYPVPALRVPDPRQGRVIAFAQARGGLGTTTLAVNVATRLLDPRGLIKRTASHKVALLDLDLQYGGVASLLDVEPSDALYRMAAQGTVPTAAEVEDALIRHPSGLDVLTAPKTLCPLEALERGQVGTIIEALRDSHDFVIVDLPRALCDWTSAVMDRVDRLLLMTDTTVPTVRQARRVIDILTEDALNVDVQLVVSREFKPMIQRRHHKVAQEVLERKFAHWLPEDPKSCRSASDRGVPIHQISRRSPLSRAIDGIARQLIEDVGTRPRAADPAQK